MVTVINDESVSVHVPAGVTDIEAFRRWADAPDFPEQGSIWWLKGEVWADMSKQQLFSHVLVKTKITVKLGAIAEAEQLGIYLTDGAMLSNFPADVAGVPDGLFVSTQTLDSDRVRLIEGKKSGFVEVQGAPDMVLEVISDGSVHKDEVMLKAAYFEAGIPEYWLIDAHRSRCDSASSNVARTVTSPPARDKAGSAPRCSVAPSVWWSRRDQANMSITRLETS